LKGEERVCHVTEADAPGANALDVSEKVSSCEAAIWHGPPPSRGLPPADAGSRVLPLCAAVLCGGANAPPGIKRKRRASGGCLGTERR
jgi:hypothetical protein